jgi:hypothetical protein
MKTISKFLFICSLSTLFLTFFSCEKEKVSDPELANLILDESETALSAFNDASESFALTNDFLFKKGSCPPSTCPKIDFDQDEANCTFDLVLDFGADGCKGWHGWTRKGKMIVHVAGCQQIVVTITFDQYSVNDYIINGTQTITFNQVGLGIPYVTIETNGSVVDPDGKESTIVATMTKSWIEGFMTPYDFSDDVYSTTGTASGVCSDGVAYQITITSPLIKAMDCKWVQSGEISLVFGDNTVVKNYGEGECDSLANVTINGKTEEIILCPKWGNYNKQ